MAEPTTMHCPFCHGNGVVLDEELSPHFHLSDFTDARDAVRSGYPNVPSMEVVRSLRQLCVELLTPLGERAGTKFLIPGGYLSPGVLPFARRCRDPSHMHGHAADLLPIHVAAENVMEALAESDLKWDRAILSKSLIHIERISQTGSQRRELLEKVGRKLKPWERKAP